MDDAIRVLIVDSDPRTIASALATLEPGYQAFTASEAAMAEDAFTRARVAIALVAVEREGRAAASFLARLKGYYATRPLQVLALIPSSDGEDERDERVRVALSAGADDFLQKKADGTLPGSELRLRLRAASLRLKAQDRLWAEREFFRQAVRQEEALSSRLLDRQLEIRESLEDARTVKENLEAEDKRLSEAARIDSLSGLLSRQSLNARLEREVKKATEAGRPLFGIMLNLDRFRAFNEKLGHEAGNEAIRAVGAIVRESVRRDDYAGRYSGDEFFIILPGAQRPVAESVASRIVSRIARERSGEGADEVSLRASLGIAEYRQGMEAAEWVAQADAALFRSRAGR